MKYKEEVEEEEATSEVIEDKPFDPDEKKGGKKRQHKFPTWFVIPIFFYVLGTWFIVQVILTGT